MADYYLDSVTGSDADNGTTRALAEATLTALLGDMAAGDRGFIDDGHSESSASALTLTHGGTVLLPFFLICVDFAGTADPSPPVSADLRTSALVATTGNTAISINGMAVYIGVQFRAGNAASNASINIANLDQAQALVFQNCELGVGGTNASSTLLFGTAAASVNVASIVCLNTNIRFAASGQGLTLRSMRMVWQGGGLVGTAPSTLFKGAADAAGWLTCVGVDLSTVTGSLVNVAIVAQYRIDFVECKLGGGVAVTTGTFSGLGGCMVLLWNCDSSDTHYRSEQYDYSGTGVTVTDVVRANGFTVQPENVAVSRRVTTSANVSRFFPWHADGPLVCSGWLSSTGSKTITIYFIHGQSAALTNGQIWLELEYLGTSGFPQALFAHDGMADVLAASANQTATSSIDWDDGATARANSTAYSIGQIRRAATPNGRLFIVTTGGTSHSSEPAAFATANDGDSVAEGSGTVVWRCMWRQSLDVTVTINEVGAVVGRVHIAVPSIDVWFCPKMEGVEQNPVQLTAPYGPALSLVAAAGGGASRGDGTGMLRHINRLG
jgi:hypothetical protein